MSGEDDGPGEKTNAPTQKRLDDARGRGDIPRSEEISAAAAYLGLLVAVATAGVSLVQGGGMALAAFLAHAESLTGAVLGAGGRATLATVLAPLVWALLPLFLLPALAVLVSLFAQRGFAFSLTKLEPKLNRLSPIAALKNKFGPTGLAEFAKRVVKLIVVTVVVYLVLRADLGRIIGTVAASPGEATSVLVSLMNKLLIGVTVLACVVAAVDWSWVQFDHQRKLRMSLQELRDEHKESEGDPQFKQKRRRRAQEIASNRMLTDVPTADVVIVNPTHVAVALRWSREKGAAPECVAKGTDEIAARIREIADTSGIPIHRDPPTARLLYQAVEIGQEVHPDHYRVVAVAIRFAEDMRARARERDGPGV